MHSHRQEEADIQRLGATGERSVVGPPSGPSAASRHQQVEDRAPVHADPAVRRVGGAAQRHLRFLDSVLPPSTAVLSRPGQCRAAGHNEPASTA